MTPAAAVHKIGVVTVMTIAETLRTSESRGGDGGPPQMPPLVFANMPGPGPAIMGAEYFEQSVYRGSLDAITSARWLLAVPIQTGSLTRSPHVTMLLPTLLSLVLVKRYACKPIKKNSKPIPKPQFVYPLGGVEREGPMMQVLVPPCVT
jgi:hypothetical protein